ncbi:TlpA family protein disulfide reductase [Riemerella anatipestifer]|uniref:TlpA disulfide reductase family protein n=1 Tax=Riemerella anatipestifer TaxID=34085 RepID=UPI0030C04860
MRKIALALTLVALVVSCDNKKTETVTTPSSSDSTKVEQTLKEVSKDELSQLVKAKENDTIYVTNFFATWCGPCMMEIPHFKEKMKELDGKPVKFTFVSIDDKKDWDTEVKKFGEEQQLSKHILLFDGQQFDDAFFSQNFKVWQGQGIPFTLVRKGNKTEEIEGSMSKEDLDQLLAGFLK